MGLKEILAGPVARIIVRYLAGALVSLGVLPESVGAQIGVDRDIALIVGAGLVAIVEWLYIRAKKNGGAT